jgi:ribosomal-protein-alanine N-acetyltransferase
MQVLFKTPRLYLRRITTSQADVDEMYAMDSDPELVRFIRPILTREESFAKLEKVLQIYETEGLGHWLVHELESDVVVGIGVIRFLENSTDIEVGYAFKPNAWGKGYATEVCKALIEYGFQRFEIPRIVACVDIENAASQRVLEKSDMTCQGIENYYGKDLYFYTITPKTL